MCKSQKRCKLCALLFRYGRLHRRSLSRTQNEPGPWSRLERHTRTDKPPLFDFNKRIQLYSNLEIYEIELMKHREPCSGGYFSKAESHCFGQPAAHNTVVSPICLKLPALRFAIKYGITLATT